MSDMVGVRCRTCGEINFVPMDRDFVQIGVPAEVYDEMIRTLARLTNKAKRERGNKPRGTLLNITDEQRVIAARLKDEGRTVRQIMVEMGWSLGTTARVLAGER